MILTYSGKVDKFRAFVQKLNTQLPTVYYTHLDVEFVHTCKQNCRICVTVCNGPAILL